MQVHADARLAAMVELCEASQKAAAAYIDFLDATDKMALAMPLGLVPHAVSWHLLPLLLDNGEFPGRVEVAVAAELYRHGVLRADGRGMLPGAAPPVESQRLRPASIEPASAAVERQNTYLLGLIDARLRAIEESNAAKFARSA